MADRTFTLKFVGDIADAKKSLGNLEKDVDGFKTSTTNAFKAIGTAISVAAIVDIGKGFVDAASNTEQALGATTSVFKEYAGQIQDFGKTTAENLGIAESEFNQLAATTGALMKNAGVPLNEVADSTVTLTERAADMAAMFGGTVSEAMDAINSGLKGELDPLEKFGVSLKASSVDAKAAALGYVDADGKVTDYGRTMARVALIMEQSADSQGTAAREAGTMAGQTQRLQAQFKDLQADLGAKLLPVLVTLAQVLRGIIEFVVANQDWLVPMVAGLMAFVAAIKIATAVQWLWNAAMLANPVGLLVAAIAALVAVIVLAYFKVDWFRELIDKLWQAIQVGFHWVKDNWPLLLAILTGPFGAAIAIIVKNWDTIKQAASGAIDAIGRTMGRVWDIITYPFRHASESILYIVDVLKGAWKGFVDALRWVFGGVYDIITYPFRRAMDMIKWLWNSTVGGFGFTVPNWIPLVGGKEFRIPEMAAGGIVRRPTVALIGEAGPEAVVPLDQYNGNGGATITYVVNVYALNATAETGRLVAESLREYNRTSGYTSGYAS